MEHKVNINIFNIQVYLWYLTHINIYLAADYDYHYHVDHHDKALTDYDL